MNTEHPTGSGSLAPWIILSVIAFIAAAAIVAVLITGNVADAERSRSAIAAAQAQAQIERTVQEQQTARESARLRADNTARAIDMMSILALPVLAIIAGLIIGGGIITLLEWTADRRHARLLLEITYLRQAAQLSQLPPPSQLALPSHRATVPTWEHINIIQE